MPLYTFSSRTRPSSFGWPTFTWMIEIAPAIQKHYVAGCNLRPRYAA